MRDPPRMHGYKRLVAWQQASELCLATLEIVDSAWTARAGVVLDQLRRAVISVDVDIVEGYALNTTPQFRRHLRIALGSAVEAERLLEIAGTRGDLRPEFVEPLTARADETIRALCGLVRSRNLRTAPTPRSAFWVPRS